MQSALKSVIVAATLVLTAGCGGSSVLMPPRIDLGAFQRIGLVEFKSNAEGDLESLASREFLQNVQSSQPGVPVLELGDEKDVLAAIGRDRIDPAAIQALGAAYQVDAVIVGDLAVTEVKPRVDVTRVFSSASVAADVEAALTTRILDAGSGATLWTRSARSTQSVANAGLDTNGGFHFETRDPEAAYGSLIQSLVQNVTADFRPYWSKE